LANRVGLLSDNAEMESVGKSKSATGRNATLQAAQRGIELISRNFGGCVASANTGARSSAG
jgi:hypothetical protein